MKSAKTLYISDLHCGARDAICPDYLGGSIVQHKLWLNFLECLDWFVKEAKGEKFIIIFGAEMVQGTWVRFHAPHLDQQYKVLGEVLNAISERVESNRLEKSFLLSGS